MAQSHKTALALCQSQVPRPVFLLFSLTWVQIQRFPQLPLPSGSVYTRMTHRTQENIILNNYGFTIKDTTQEQPNERGA